MKLLGEKNGLGLGVMFIVYENAVEIILFFAIWKTIRMYI